MDALSFKRIYCKSFALIFVPLLAVLGVIVATLLLIDVRSQKAILSSNEENQVQLISQVVQDDLQSMNSDLFYLANLPPLKSYLDAEVPSSDLIAEDFLLFSKHRKIYDQIRYLDSSGMEIVRINFDGHSSTVVPPDQLQSKAGRYYFKSTLELNRGEVYVSPFDLNVENGAVERPFKPMLRVSTPVFDNEGHKRGAIVLNYLGQIMLDHLHKYFSQDVSSLMLLNSEGYWLKGLSPEEEWGFMFSERNEATMQNKFPDVWKQCTQSHRGQLHSAKGLFTFATIYPLQSGQVSCPGSCAEEGEVRSTISSNEYFWKIISFVPPQVVNAKIYGLVNVILIVSAAGVALLLFLAHQVATNAVQREQTSALVHSMAYKDTLTELPNRRLFEDRLQQEVALAQRSGKKVAALFLDLDHFKEVNDTLGHEAGDQLLQQVARRLEKLVRKSDTVARLGGDEFILLLSNLDKLQDADIVADKVIRELSSTFSLAGQELHVGTSVGIAIYPSDSESLEQLIACADKALYRAKQEGRNRYVRYADMNDTAVSG